MTYTYSSTVQSLPTSYQKVIAADRDLQNHIKEHQLDNEEIIILIDGEQKRYQPLSHQEEKKIRDILTQAANQHISKKQTKKQITIRLSEYDITQLKHIASKEWLPYQTYISSTLHKIANSS